MSGVVEGAVSLWYRTSNECDRTNPLPVYSGVCTSSSSVRCVKPWYTEYVSPSPSTRCTWVSYNTSLHWLQPFGWDTLPLRHSHHTLQQQVALFGRMLKAVLSNWHPTTCGMRHTAHPVLLRPCKYVREPIRRLRAAVIRALCVAVVIKHEAERSMRRPRYEYEKINLQSYPGIQQREQAAVSSVTLNNRPGIPGTVLIQQL